MNLMMGVWSMLRLASSWPGKVANKWWATLVCVALSLAPDKPILLGGTRVSFPAGASASFVPASVLSFLPYSH